MNLLLTNGDVVAVPPIVASVQSPSVDEVIGLLNTYVFLPRHERCYRLLMCPSRRPENNASHTRLLPLRDTSHSSLLLSCSSSSSVVASGLEAAPPVGDDDQVGDFLHTAQLVTNWAEVPRDATLLSLTRPMGGSNTVGGVRCLGEVGAQRSLLPIKRRAFQPPTGSRNNRSNSPGQDAYNKRTQNLMDYVVRCNSEVSSPSLPPPAPAPALAGEAETSLSPLGVHSTMIESSRPESTGPSPIPTTTTVRGDDVGTSCWASTCGGGLTLTRDISSGSFGGPSVSCGAPSSTLGGNSAKNGSLLIQCPSNGSFTTQFDAACRMVTGSGSPGSISSRAGSPSTAATGGGHGIMHRSAVSLVSAIARDKGEALTEAMLDVFDERQHHGELQQRQYSTSSSAMSNDSLLRAFTVSPPPPFGATPPPNYTDDSVNEHLMVSMIPSQGLDQLMDMGFGLRLSCRALLDHELDVTAAVSWLLQLEPSQRLKFESPMNTSEMKHYMNKLLLLQQASSPSPSAHSRGHTGGNGGDSVHVDPINRSFPGSRQGSGIATCVTSLSLKSISLTDDQRNNRTHFNRLLEMGFRGSDARVALRSSEGDFEAACSALLLRGGGGGSQNSPHPHHISPHHHHHHQQQQQQTQQQVFWFDPIEKMVRSGQLDPLHVIDVVKAVQLDPQNILLLWHCPCYGNSVMKMASIFTAGSFSASQRAASAAAFAAYAPSSHHQHNHQHAPQQQQQQGSNHYHHHQQQQQQQQACTTPPPPPPLNHHTRHHHHQQNSHYYNGHHAGSTPAAAPSGGGGNGVPVASSSSSQPSSTERYNRRSNTRR